MKTANLGNLFIISAPSGGGKTTLVKRLVKEISQLKVSVSHTTRPMRSNEIDGINYNFVSEQKFFELQKKGLFLEFAPVFNNWYGTSRAWVEEQLHNGIDVILEIDWQGAQAVKSKISSIGIFIIPPSKEILASRLRERNLDSPEVIAHRLRLASQEISHYYEYDYLIVNNDFEHALMELKAVILSQRLLISRQKNNLSSLLSTMTKLE